MILRSRDDVLEVITQPDHARLSRRIMERCPALDAHPRRASVLLAVAEHDNGWTEADAAPSVDPATGRPLDFVAAPLEVRHAVWPRGVERLSADPWAAALVANHALTVYDHYRADTAWGSFFSRMTTLRDEMLGASGRSLADLIADYTYVRLGDLLSLVFCTGWTEPQRFERWTVTRTGACVALTPDLFDRDAVPLDVPARVVMNRPFRDDQDLRETLSRAEVISLVGEVHGT